MATVTETRSVSADAVDQAASPGFIDSVASDTEGPWAAAAPSPRLSCWLHVREFAVPPSMIDTATDRRAAGDWAGACAAARVDVDFDLRRLARRHGRELVARLRLDLRHLVPDLLRWHLPRSGPDGLLRPGITLSLAQYEQPDPARPPLHLVVRTPPAWAEAGQRVSLAVWDGSAAHPAAGHPHPRPGARFRLDLHRHLWDVRRVGELRWRAGRGSPPPPSYAGSLMAHAAVAERWAMSAHWAVDRWMDEARLVRDAEACPAEGPVSVRLGSGLRLAVDTRDGRIAPDPGELPVLPDAATWVPPDVELLRAGLIDADRLHPMVASALTGRSVDAARVRRDAGEQAQLVDCRGSVHRIGFVDGMLAALDHDRSEVHREELLVAFGGPPLPCLQVIDDMHRKPEELSAVRERLAHGDVPGAFAVLEGLLGPEARLREGPLRDALEEAVERRIAHGLYRAGLTNHGPLKLLDGGALRSHPREASFR
ncbi:hypothetical protein ACIBI4_02085 [Streptomyces sp. NPDC050418]|uniref:hypothetical protein n=1 Tax=Streptomyces sp. NPDC050418 TaxID=3365612 RepID=UPI003798AB53